VTTHRVVLARVAVACLLLTACTHDAAATGTVPAENATTAPALPIVADELPAMDAGGFQQLIQQLRGTPVVVNYWAAWCPPCKAEIPLLVQAHRQLGRDVQFVGVDMQDFRSGARTFMHGQDMTYPSVFDPANSIGLSFNLFSPPMTQFYGADGRLVATVRGQLSTDTLQTNLKAIAP
jgi:cytochrome c biogenesis protein CcmG, thiol:disulfide interchange protein DsbE